MPGRPLSFSVPVRFTRPDSCQGNTSASPRGSALSVLLSGSLQVKAVDVDGALSGKDKEERFPVRCSCPFETGGEVCGLSLCGSYVDPGGGISVFGGAYFQNALRISLYADPDLFRLPQIKVLEARHGAVAHIGHILVGTGGAVSAVLGDVGKALFGALDHIRGEKRPLKSDVAG